MVEPAQSDSSGNKTAYLQSHNSKICVYESALARLSLRCRGCWVCVSARSFEKVSISIDKLMNSIFGRCRKIHAIYKRRARAPDLSEPENLAEFCNFRSSHPIEKSFKKQLKEVPFFVRLLCCRSSAIDSFAVLPPPPLIPGVYRRHFYTICLYILGASSPIRSHGHLEQPRPSSCAPRETHRTQRISCTNFGVSVS